MSPVGRNWVPRVVLIFSSIIGTVNANVTSLRDTNTPLLKESYIILIFVTIRMLYIFSIARCILRCTLCLIIYCIVPYCVTVNTISVAARSKASIWGPSVPGLAVS